VQGEPGAVDDIVQWAHRGPARAQVDEVDIQPAEGDFARFEILYG
jgi:acylphosphatase